MTSPRLAKLVTSDTLGLTLVDLYDDNKTYPPPAGFAVEAGGIVSYRLTDKTKGPVVVENLIAAPDSARASIYNALSEHGLDPAFSESVQREAEGIIEAADFSDPGLSDLTDLPFISSGI